MHGVVATIVHVELAGAACAWDATEDRRRGLGLRSLMRMGRIWPCVPEPTQELPFGCIVVGRLLKRDAQRAVVGHTGQTGQRVARAHSVSV